ncbi:hypothetical protein ACQY0O_007612 [Thecaphora frezii]
MSATQITPRPAPLNLAFDKSLPPAPQEAEAAAPTDRPVQRAADRPALQPSWISAPDAKDASLPAPLAQARHELEATETRARSVTPSWRPLDLASSPEDAATILLSATHLSRSHTVRPPAMAAPNRPPSLLSHADTTLASGMACSAAPRPATSSAMSPTRHHAYRDSINSAGDHSPDVFFSPFVDAPASPEASIHVDTAPRLRSISNGGDVGVRCSASQSVSRGSTLRDDVLAAGEASNQPSEPSLGFFAHLPDPSSFPLPSTSRMGSAAGSPMGARLSRGSRGNSLYSSDMSVRNSTSTRGSVWTDRSQTSCNTSPGGPFSSGGLGFEPFPKAQSSSEGSEEETEEIDERSVGLGITSDDEMGVASSRRSCAAPVVPSAYITEGSPALSGPFSHHRAPSWTRKSDLANLASLTLGISANGADADRPTIVRTTSELGPVGVRTDDAIMPSSAATRSWSRQRCSSEASQHKLPGHLKSSSSISSILSLHGNGSQHFNPAVAHGADGNAAVGLTRTKSSSTCSSVSMSRSMQANVHGPPRSSSLRQSDSTFSQPVRKDSLSRKTSIRRKASVIQTERHMPQSSSYNLLSGTEPRLEPAVELRGDSPEPDVAAQGTSGKRTAASDASHRMSSVSINSFLHGAEFSHILGAYADRFRWDEDGLYGFDESAETEDEDSQAVKTAQDGSAAIVHANGREIAEIEKEAGPNTTHLVLRNCSEAGILEMLERVLPSTQRLLVLDVSGCYLPGLPVSLGNCLSLEELDVSHNPLGVLPDFVSNLRALRVLSADDTGLRALPSGLSNLQDLQCLSLQKNLFTHLPSWLHRLAKLDRLLLDGNRFKGVWQEVVSPIVRPSSSDAAHVVCDNAPLASPRSSSPFVAAVSPDTTVGPTARRLKSIGDLHKPQLALDTSVPTSPEEDSGPSSTASPKSNGRLPFSAADAYNGVRQPGAFVEASVPSRPESRRGSEAFEDGHGGVGKWGFLKKISRKASSSRLGVMYNEHIGTTDSRTTSPKPTRAVLRNSGGPVTRPRSRSGSASVMSNRNSMSPPPLPSFRMDTLAESELNIPAHIPMTPFSPSFPASAAVTPQPTAPGSAASTLSATSRQAKRRSFLPMQGYQAVQPTATPDATSTEADELDEAALAQHRQRLRALMHYLRDLDDLTSIKASPSTSPTIRESITSGDFSSEGLHFAMTRNSSIASGDSSASSLFKSSASFASTAASTPAVEEEKAKRSSGPDEGVQEASLKDDSVRRVRIIEEVVRTEETYVRGLTELVEIYVKPAQLPVDGNGGPPTVPMSEQRAVFGNVEAILRFHTDVFLPALRSAARPLLEKKVDANAEGASDFTALVAESVASVFTHHAAFFKMYMSYINNCDSAQSRINVWMAPSSVIHAGTALKAAGINSQQPAHGTSQILSGTPLGYDFGLAPAQRKKIKTFMKRCRAHPKHTQLNVESYLLLPVQRIPRYRLLLEDLVRSTDPSRLRSPEALSRALEHVSRIASNVNESKRQSEQDRKLLSWQFRIRGNLESPLVQPHRRLIRDGPLRLRRIVKRVPGFIRPSVAIDTLDPVARVPGDGLQVMQVDHLAQSSENLPLTLVLCNDVVVVVHDPSGGRDTVSPVTLYAMLHLEKPVEIVGAVNLRLVDRKAIMYFAARSHEEAVTWKTALNSQLQ